jgi:hypothetical protein
LWRKRVRRGGEKELCPARFTDVVSKRKVGRLGVYLDVVRTFWVENLRGVYLGERFARMGFWRGEVFSR